MVSHRCETTPATGATQPGAAETDEVDSLVGLSARPYLVPRVVELDCAVHRAHPVVAGQNPDHGGHVAKHPRVLLQPDPVLFVEPVETTGVVGSELVGAADLVGH